MTSFFRYLQIIKNDGEGITNLYRRSPNIHKATNEYYKYAM